MILTSLATTFLTLKNIGSDMNIEKAVKEIKMLNPTQRHVFFENFEGKIPGVQFKKHSYQSLPELDANNTVVCRDSFNNKMYLMEIEEY